jgi:hypothetical protein
MATSVPFLSLHCATSSSATASPVPPLTADGVSVLAPPPLRNRPEPASSVKAATFIINWPMVEGPKALYHARGCAPTSPDAEMSSTQHFFSTVFQDASEEVHVFARIRFCSFSASRCIGPILPLICAQASLNSISVAQQELSSLKGGKAQLPTRHLSAPPETISPPSSPSSQAAYLQVGRVFFKT